MDIHHFNPLWERLAHFSFNFYHILYLSYLNLSVVCAEAVDQLLLRFCMRLISESLRGSL